jgi:carbon monoxide dehydrogenase subunit G
MIRTPALLAYACSVTHRVVRTFETTCGREPAFDYVVDFSTTQERDPGIPSAHRLDEGPPAVGSRFSLVSRFNETEQTIVYEITALERPVAVTFVGEGRNFHGVDVISFASRPEGGTLVTYEADLSLKGLARLAEPLIRGKLDAMSDKAVEGLKAALDRRA